LIRHWRLDIIYEPALKQTTKTVAWLPISVNKCRDDGEAQR
jgi:hypothetical protein